MPTVRSALSSVALAAALAGCLGPTTPAGRVQEAANDLNTSARFGRMDLAMDHVGKELREDFRKRHAQWGNQIRVMEAEFSGMSFKQKDDAEIYVTITWQQLSDSDLRTTTVRQTWHDDRGWRLTKEERASGDYGLFGDAAPAGAPKPAQPGGAQFQTVYIR